MADRFPKVGNLSHILAFVTNLSASDRQLAGSHPGYNSGFSYLSRIFYLVFISLLIMIVAENIHKSFGKVEVLKGIDLRVHEQEIVSITGASGAGKSTLLQILGTIEKPDKGRVILDGTEINRMNDKALSAFRNRKIGFVFQFHHLLPEFTALENICIPAFIAGKSRKEAETRAYELLDFIQLTHRASHKPAALSGGEQQRVAVARALTNNPSVVFADEPSGNLDSAASESLHRLFLDLRRDFGQTFVIVTHNKSLATLADRQFFIKDGMITKENI
jgi:lipoprotein-releasing system ATP-binding protein